MTKHNSSNSIHTTQHTPQLCVGWGMDKDSKCIDKKVGESNIDQKAVIITYSKKEKLYSYSCPTKSSV